jgi:hypothetical protein
MTYTYVGNCVDSFDDDTGDCIIDQLGWDDVSNFACELEDASVIGNDEARCNIGEKLVAELVDGSDLDSLEFTKTGDGVLIMYDPEEDIHYFFLED